MSQQTENKKKRGRKKKSETIITENIQIEINANEIPIEQNPPVVKKRGRKPKGGKIITKEKNNIDTSTTIPNVILHLKCFLNPDMLN